MTFSLVYFKVTGVVTDKNMLGHSQTTPIKPIPFTVKFQIIWIYA